MYHRKINDDGLEMIINLTGFLLNLLCSRFDKIHIQFFNNYINQQTTYKLIVVHFVTEH